MTVLIIDDNPVDRRIDRRRPEAASSNYRLYEAKDGTTGSSVSQSLQPDCLLLDLRLTHGSGFEVLVTLVGEAEKQAIPVIMLCTGLLLVVATTLWW